MDVEEIMKAPFLATEHGDTEGVASLVDANPGVLSLFWQGKTLLMHAAANNQVGVMSLLLERGAAIDAVREEDFPTALCHAVANGHAEAVAFLLDGGADIRGGFFLYAPVLTTASRKGHLAVVKLLMKHMERLGMDIRTHGRSALEHACRGGHVAVVRALLLAGADYNHIRSNWQPKFFGRFHAHHELIEVRVLVHITSHACGSGNAGDVA